MKGAAFRGSAGGEPAEEESGGTAGDARRQRDLWPAAAIWQRRETKPVWAERCGDLGRLEREWAWAC
jgi:hypothetical protein